MSHGSDADPNHVLASAQAHARAGNYAAALSDYRWCVEHCLEVSSSFIGVWGGRVIPGVVELSRVYPDARKYVVELQHKFESAIVGAAPPQVADRPLEAWVILPIHAALGIKGRAVNLVLRATPLYRVALFEDLLPSLVMEKQYEVVVKQLALCDDAVARQRRALKLIRAAGGPVEASRYQEVAVLCFEALVGVGARGPATALAGQILDDLRGAEIVDALRAAGARAGGAVWAGAIDDIVRQRDGETDRPPPE